MSAPTPRTGNRRRATRAVAWTLVGAASLELTARHFISAPFPCLRPSADPEVLFELRPGTYEVTGYMERLPAARLTIDNDGCQRLGEAPSVLVLGSSHAFGLGVSRGEALPERLRAALHARGHALPGVADCSVPGHHFVQQVRVAERALAARAYPLTIILVAEHHLREGFDWSKLAPRSPVTRWLTSHVRVARVLYLLHLQREFESFGTRHAPPPRLEAALDRLAAAARARGGTVALATLDIVEHPRFDLAAEARRRGLLVVNVALPPHDAQWTLDGEHWTARGHARVADELAARLDPLLRAQAARRPQGPPGR